MDDTTKQMIQRIADSYKKDTGYCNCLGTVRSNLEKLWPYIIKELEKDVDK